MFLTVLAGVVKPGYDILEQTVSELAVGAHGWIQTVNFFIVGGAMVAFALALAATREPVRRSRAAMALFAAAGLAVCAAAFFPTDLAGAPETADGVVHNMLFLGTFLALIAAIALQGSKLTAAGIFALLVVFVMFAGDVGDPLHGAAGALERVLIAVPLVWITLAARRLAPLGGVRSLAVSLRLLLIAVLTAGAGVALLSDPEPVRSATDDGNP
jgi:hypothetical protein